MPVAVSSDRPMPKGMLRSGFLTSSATLATFVRPAYETKTIPMVARKPRAPSVKKGVNSPAAPPTALCPPQTDRTPCAA